MRVGGWGGALDEDPVRASGCGKSAGWWLNDHEAHALGLLFKYTGRSQKFQSFLWSLACDARVSRCLGELPAAQTLPLILVTLFRASDPTTTKKLGTFIWYEPRGILRIVSRQRSLRGQILQQLSAPVATTAPVCVAHSCQLPFLGSSAACRLAAPLLLSSAMTSSEQTGSHAQPWDFDCGSFFAQVPSSWPIPSTTKAIFLSCL